MKGASSQADVKAETRHNIRCVADCITAVALILLCSCLCVADIMLHKYPKFNAVVCLLLFFASVPTLVLFIKGVLRLKFKKAVNILVTVFFAFSLPFLLLLPMGIVSRSETTDIRNYRRLDAYCLANRNAVFLDFFPAWAPDGENGKYYYMYSTPMDYTYDIYAEWSLAEEKFTAEVQRVQAVFQNAVENKTYGYTEVDKGDFRCLILYSGDEPFCEAKGNYTYAVFAYSEQSKTVRYIFCDSLENGVDQPYYLQLDWNEVPV